MRTASLTRLIFCFLFALGACTAFAQEPSPTPPIIPPGKKLIVGIYDKPPYAIKNEDGDWTGLSVDLWTALARQLNLTYEYRETPYEQMLPDLRSQKLDFVIAELPVEAELEKVIDFSQPFLTSSLGIAMATKSNRTDWRRLIPHIFGGEFLELMLCIVLGIFIASYLIWRVERKHHNDHFGGKTLAGFGSAVWFSAVTMTTVGYGDKTPQTLLGRVIAFVWMMVGVLIIAAFTAMVATTATSLNFVPREIKNPNELRGTRIGVVTDSSAEIVLKKHQIATFGYKSTEAALDALLKEEVSSVVDDRMVLAYLQENNYAGKVQLLSLRFHEFYVSFAMPDDSAIRETLNIALLELIHSSEWKKQLSFWVGKNNSPAY
ncbi:MAG: transporter substrate-binding domain-containing protein [Chthoniobacterales bacterium]